VREEPVKLLFREPARRGLEADRGSVARPRPVRGTAADSGSNGIERDVTRQLEKVLVAFEQDVAVRNLEDVPDVFVSSVEALRIGAAEVPHSLRQVRLRRLDDKVEVIRHQAISEADPPEASDGTPHQPYESVPVVDVDEDPLARVTPRRHVVGLLAALAG
jgi:hypothetical protein